MLLIGIPVLLIVFYIGMVSGSYKKLNDNGIFLKGKAKLVFPILPLAIIIFHLVWSIKNIFRNPKLSLQVLELTFLKYPILLGVLIELILENVALELSSDKKIVSIQKRKSIKKAVQKSNALDFSDMRKNNSKKFVRDYQNTVIPLFAS
jgi:hypothetical protein